jgi:predicted polyphosphate/ATP-dependent NAD kinase
MMQSKGRKFRLGLVVNPFAGIGGALALKGSDGEAIRTRALAAGAEKLAMQKASLALAACKDIAKQIEVFTGSGDLGANSAKEHGLTCHEVYAASSEQTQIEDTFSLVDAIVKADIDLLLFAGGDGTARNICERLPAHIPVLGVPAGCKIHSGVYAITPKAAGKVLRQVVLGELVSLQSAEVRDIDEARFRQGQVIAKHFGELQVPFELAYIQAVKMGGKESDELLLDDIADYVIEIMQESPDTLFVMGSGSTVNAIMEKAGLDNTLLGVDIVKDMQVLHSDVTAKTLLKATHNQPTKLVCTLIGGQGHILGRGNQQLSPSFIRQIGKQNMLLVATKAKLQALGDKGLISDSGDTNLDADMAGPIPVITGYKDHVLYFVRSET